MIVTQDHINYYINYLKAINKENAITIQIEIIKILECINIKRKGRWENISFILETDKQQLVVEEDD